jgi:two-component system cell cycle sensor histidine kinase/response regulator CckA
MSKPLRVLVVEDSERDLELLLRALHQGGYVVRHQRVETAEAMRTALAEAEWDIVISDYSLPTFDGLEALATLRRSGIDLPFIIVSGTIGEDVAVGALLAGAGDFLVKGQMARLIPAIERELRECQVRSARRRAEAALRESEARYRRIIETTNEGVMMLDASNLAIFANRRMGALLGYEPAELLGLSIFDLAHETSRAALAHHLEQPSQDAVGRQIETRLVRKDQGDLWVLLDSTPLLDDDGRPTGTLVMVMDVTQRRLLEDQLRQAQKMEAVGRLAGGVAHDFNNLLSVILSYTNMVIGGLKSGDPIRADLEEVEKAGERARELTHQLLAFSRKQVIEPRHLDLNHVIREMERMVRRLLGESFDLSLLTDHKLGTVFADPGQVEQIVMNLVVNARDAMPEGGKITIETGNVDLDQSYALAHHDVRPGSYVLLAVTDSGSGIDPVILGRIFEPFFTTKDAGQGTGLGLSTVFGIVKQSGGHIWVYSERGKGTTFKIYLPRKNALPDPLSAPAPAPASLRGTETVLLVEDEQQVRAAARVILRRQGYNVLEAQNGGEGFLICERYQGKIDLLVTDVVMPHMSGKELAARLAGMRPEMRVLFLSGYTENSIVHHGILDSGVSFLQKPITPDSLARKVRAVLDGAPKIR